MKVNSSIYKGIEFVQVTALPADQQEKLLQTINPELLIKILVDGKLVNNCLQFKDYEIWFDTIFALHAPAKSKKEVKQIVNRPVISTGHV